MIWEHSENVLRLFWECSAPNPHSYTPGQDMQLSYLIKANYCNTLHAGENFMLFVVICWLFQRLFQIQLFWFFFSGRPSECQTAWTQIRPDILSGLIWVQAVYNWYQQPILAGKVLMNLPSTIQLGLITQEDSHLEFQISSREFPAEAVWSGPFIVGLSGYPFTSKAWLYNYPNCMGEKVLNFKNPEL